MDRIPVISSNLASVGYDAASQTLEIEFKSGKIYQYFDVPETIYNELMAAESLGGYLHQQIREVFRHART